MEFAPQEVVGGNCDSATPENRRRIWSEGDESNMIKDQMLKILGERKRCKRCTVVTNA